MHQGDECSPHRRVVQIRDVRDIGPEARSARDATSVGARRIGKATGESIIRPSNVNRSRYMRFGEPVAVARVLIVGRALAKLPVDFSRKRGA
jgi:hypothetical protein